MAKSKKIQVTEIAPEVEPIVVAEPIVEVEPIVESTPEVIVEVAPVAVGDPRIAVIGSVLVIPAKGGDLKALVNVAAFTVLKVTKYRVTCRAIIGLADNGDLLVNENTVEFNVPQKADTFGYVKVNNGGTVAFVFDGLLIDWLATRTTAAMELVAIAKSANAERAAQVAAAEAALLANGWEHLDTASTLVDGVYVARTTGKPSFSEMVPVTVVWQAGVVKGWEWNYSEQTRLFKEWETANPGVAMGEEVFAAIAEQTAIDGIRITASLFYGTGRDQTVHSWDTIKRTYALAMAAMVEHWNLSTVEQPM